MNINNILSGLKEENGIFRKEGYQSAIHNWDALSKVNAISAAISAPDEEAEKIKSLAPTEFLMANLNDGVILDVGCGYGRAAKYLLPRRIFEGYIGLDSSIQMLELFRDRYKTEPLEQRTSLALVYNNIDNMPFLDNSIDNVIVSAVFLHNPKHITEKSIAEIRRILKPGGKLFVLSSFPNKFSLTGLQGEAYLLFLKLIGRGDKNGPVRYFSKNDIAKYLKDFSSYEVTPVGFEVIPKSILFFPGFLNRAYRKVIFEPINGLAKSIFGKSKKFCTHLEVVAKK